MERLIPAGSTITLLDDIALYDSDRNDHWYQYLITPFDETSPYENLGFCLDADTFAGSFRFQASLIREIPLHKF